MSESSPRTPTQNQFFAAPLLVDDAAIGVWSFLLEVAHMDKQQQHHPRGPQPDEAGRPDEMGMMEHKGGMGMGKGHRQHGMRQWGSQQSDMWRTSTIVLARPWASSV